MAIVLAIVMIASSVFFMNLQPALKNVRVTNAYNTTLETLRRAREASVSTRWIYVVSFSNSGIPNTITVTQTTVNGSVLLQSNLPTDISFQVISGVPTSQNGAYTTPDGFGTASKAIDFDQLNGGGASTIYFYPDGSARNASGGINNGVVYLAHSGDLYSSRAITVWGLTGRLRGFRLYGTGGSTPSTYWRQQ